ncbi:MAG: divergent polysaccharide deacetylase family protein [Thermodesulfobacteriota bacterium]
MTAPGKSPRRIKTAAVKQAKKEKEKKPPRSRLLVKSAGATILLAILVLAGGLAVIYLAPDHGPVVKPVQPAHVPATKIPVFEVYPGEKQALPSPPTHTGDAVPAPSPPAGVGDTADLPSPPAVGQPRIAIIIDDIGYDRKIANRLITTDPALTLSILPESPFRREIAAAAREAGLEVMLHLPMEPEEYPHVDPGPGVLLTGMAPDALIGQLEADIADIPYITGVNNHMGSKLTTESVQLYQIFTVLKKKNLFFIDSRTTENSLCRPSAKKLQLPFAERDVFLDNTLSEADITRQVNQLADTAVRHGKAIGIGHPHPETCRVLADQLPLIKQRVQLVPASMLVTISD